MAANIDVFFVEGENNFAIDIMEWDGSVYGAVLGTIPLGENFNLVEDDYPNNSRLVIKPNSGAEVLGVSVSDNTQPWDPGLGFSLIAGFYSAEINLAPYSTNGELATITADVIGGSGPVTLSPFNVLFLLNNDKLVELSEVDIYRNVPGGSTEQVNESEYVINLLSIPFESPAEAIGPDIEIDMGSLSTGVIAPRINVDIVTIPVGDITVGDLKNNSLDFYETNYDLFLPFVSESIQLDYFDIIDKIISITYVLDCYTGDVTVNISNGGDELISSFKAETGREIPIQLFGEASRQLTGFRGLYNGVKSAFIRKTYPELVESSYNLVSKNGNLTNVFGYVEVENINLKTSANLVEKTEILSLLLNGVYINE